MPYRKLFLSRWAALLWAGGVLWTAIDIVGFAPPDKTPAATTGNAAESTDATDATDLQVNDVDLAILANAMQGN